MAREDGLEVDQETLRRWLLAEALRREDRPRQKHRQGRERKAGLGEMGQLDGWHPDWFEGRAERCVLLVRVDDATNRVGARFFEGESTRASCDTLEQWVPRHGVPRALYGERESLYRCERGASVAEPLAGPEPSTQFGPAMEQLGVRWILARSPQAKGRVERMNRVLQERLVKALRWEGMSDLERANRYSAKSFLSASNRRSAREAAPRAEGHGPVPGNWDEILSWEQQRVVQRDWRVSWEGRRDPLDRRHEALSLVGRRFSVRPLRNGRGPREDRGQKLRGRPLPEQAQRAKEPVERKRKAGG